MSARVAAGAFGEWLAAMRRVLRGEQDADVPCGSCVGCCVSSYPIPLRPEDELARTQVPEQWLLGPARAGERWLMGFREDGSCPFLSQRCCSIYAGRPQTCRDYDCRIYAAAGLLPDGGRPVIAERVGAWEFGFSSRQDNADARLTPLSHAIGLASQERMDLVGKKNGAVANAREILDKVFLTPEEINPYLVSVGSSALANKQKALQVLLRPNVSLKAMTEATGSLTEMLEPFDNQVVEQIEILTKYQTYIDKERELVSKMAQLEDLVIPENFSYEKLSSLSNEARQKFIKIKPRTLGQASRISGVNPSDVQILMVFMGR
jgi:hypothetical protein